MHQTFFKHDMQTRAESKEQRKKEQAEAIDQCYEAVNLRDKSICRVTGEYLTPGASDPKKRREHHHLIRRSRGGLHETKNVLTVSAFVHQLDHASKIRLSGDANLVDALGHFCGVKYESITESGWEVQAWI